MNIEKKTCLVLGSSGTIGSVLCKAIRDRGDEVIECDIVRGMHEDLSDRFNLNSLLGKIRKSDFVYFLAFDVGGAKFLYSRQNQFNFLNNNMKIMTNVFEALSIERTPFVFVSSMMATMPWSSYGKLKLYGEDCTACLGTGVSARFWNVYGNEKICEKSHVIPDFIHQARTAEKIQMMTTGEEVRQFIHVQDAVKALELIRNNWGSDNGPDYEKGEVIDITNGKWMAIGEIAYAVSKQMNSVPVLQGTKKDLVQSNMKVEPKLHRINSYPFNWRPEIDLDLGVSMVIKESL